MLQKTISRSQNILLIGRGTIAVNCLMILKKNKTNPKIIICDSDDNGVDAWNKSLFKYAKELGYKVGKNLFRQTKVNDPNFINNINKLKPEIDIMFSVQPKAIFNEDFIALARENIFNLHFAPLPKLRGVQTSSWAIIDGLKKMGVTLHLIEKKGIDNDPIVAQKLFPIKKNDTAWSLYNKCISHGTTLFKSSLPKLIQNKYKSYYQNSALATYHGLNELDYSNLKIPINKTVEETSRFIRARIFPPVQLPFFIFKGLKIKVKAVSLASTRLPKVLKPSGKNSYYLPCQDGTLMLSVV